MNIGKGLLALVVMGVLLLSTGVEFGDTRGMALLAISGIIGIALGDTLYFLTLIRLGSRLTLLLGSLIPVTTAIIAAVFLKENISALAWAGVALTIFGVTYVMWERRTPEKMTDSHRDNRQLRYRWMQGIGLGLIFVIANALSIIFSKLAVAQIPAMDATFIRQLWAIFAMAFWGTVTAQLVPWLRPLANPRLLKPLVIAAFIGAFLGTWLSIVALKYTYVTVAVVLNSTSPLFILPMAVWVLKEEVSLRSMVGAVIAVMGIGVYFFSL